MLKLLLNLNYKPIIKRAKILKMKVQGNELLPLAQEINTK